MIPPKSIGVLDAHGGFTAITTIAIHGGRKRYPALIPGTDRHGDTLWRPGKVLEKTTGELVEYNQRSFYQLNNDVTIAVYRVPGYSYPIAIWFDNTTGKRIA